MTLSYTLPHDFASPVLLARPVDPFRVVQELPRVSLELLVELDGHAHHLVDALQPELEALIALRKNELPGPQYSLGVRVAGIEAGEGHVSFTMSLTAPSPRASDTLSFSSR